MKVKRMVKRLFAVGTGVAMLGATAMGAMAAGLNDYPTSFVDGGVFNGLLVVGENAQSVDNLAMTDIASSMKVSSGGSSTVSVSGDSWKVATSSKKLEMANSNATSSSILGESFREITTFIGDEELGALGDGTWSTNENEYGFQQFLFFDAINSEGDSSDSRLVKYTENDDDVTADHLFIASSKQIARYRLEFTSTAQSDVTDSSGTADTTGTYLDDFENTDLTFLGKDYSVVLARRPSASPVQSVKLTLMAGAARDTLLEGETKTYNVKDKSYEVSLTFTDATDAKFVVNGESTNKLKVGETYVLSDKSEIGVSEILYQSYAGGVHSATFFVGAQKMELRDDNVTKATSTNDIKVGSEDIDGAAVIITGTDDSTTFTITTIEVNMTAQDDYFVGAGQKLSDVIAAAGEEKEVLMNNNFDVEYQGLADETTHDIKLKSSSSRRYKLRLFDGDGNPVDIPVAYAENATHFSFGEDSQSGTSRTSQKRLIKDEALFIEKDDYFIVTGGTAADGSAKSYLLQYKGQDKTTATSPKMKFKNVGNGETLEYSVSSSNSSATIKLGGYSFAVNGQSSTQKDVGVKVDLNGLGTVAPANVSFIDSYGSQWALANSGAGGFNNMTVLHINQTVPNGDDYDNILPSALRVAVTAAAGPEVRASLAGVTLVTPDGETEVSYGWTSIGSFIKLNAPSSDPQELTLTYPEKQRLPQVFLTSGATTTSTSKNGNLVAVEVVDATRLDSEVADLTAQNLIVVGGPCVNTVAASLMGNPADCTEGFTPGKARIKLVEHANGNMAMLVAGYSGADTRLAGRVVAHRWKELSGSEVEVEGTTYSDATISAPSKQ